MKRAFGFLFALAIAIPMSAACGNSEADDCKTDDDCGSNLTCQPIPGRGDRCCPSPSDSSNYEDCHGLGENQTNGTSPITTASAGNVTATPPDSGATATTPTTAADGG